MKISFYLVLALLVITPALAFEEQAAQTFAADAAAAETVYTEVAPPTNLGTVAPVQSPPLHAQPQMLTKQAPAPGAQPIVPTGHTIQTTGPVSPPQPIAGVHPSPSTLHQAPPSPQSPHPVASPLAHPTGAVHPPVAPVGGKAPQGTPAQPAKPVSKKCARAEELRFRLEYTHKLPADRKAAFEKELKKLEGKCPATHPGPVGGSSLYTCWGDAKQRVADLDALLASNQKLHQEFHKNFQEEKYWIEKNCLKGGKGGKGDKVEGVQKLQELIEQVKAETQKSIKELDRRIHKIEEQLNAHTQNAHAHQAQPVHPQVGHPQAPHVGAPHTGVQQPHVGTPAQTHPAHQGQPAHPAGVAHPTGVAHPPQAPHVDPAHAGAVHVDPAHPGVQTHVQHSVGPNGEHIETHTTTHIVEEHHQQLAPVAQHAQPLPAHHM